MNTSNLYVKLKKKFYRILSVVVCDKCFIIFVPHLCTMHDKNSLLNIPLLLRIKNVQMSGNCFLRPIGCYFSICHLWF